MTFCGLRSVSPVHMEYVRNMMVGATLTLSLLTDNRLWGLLVCHHREARLPSPALRSSCDLISQILSFLIRQYMELDASMILINLDRFKLVNEAFGRSVGDDLLLQASGRLSEFAKADVLIAGLGGDEFGALCMGMTAPAVEETAQRIRNAWLYTARLSNSTAVLGNQTGCYVV
jgi:light-regulated signal transduction histidine kinase (bacteriophytochrome)